MLKVAPRNCWRVELLASEASLLGTGERGGAKTRRNDGAIPKRSILGEDGPERESPVKRGSAFQNERCRERLAAGSFWPPPEPPGPMPPPAPARGAPPAAPPCMAPKDPPPNIDAPDALPLPPNEDIPALVPPMSPIGLLTDAEAEKSKCPDRPRGDPNEAVADPEGENPCLDGSKLPPCPPPGSSPLPPAPPEEPKRKPPGVKFIWNPLCSHWFNRGSVPSAVPKALVRPPLRPRLKSLAI